MSCTGPREEIPKDPLPTRAASYHLSRVTTFPQQFSANHNMRPGDEILGVQLSEHIRER